MAIEGSLETFNLPEILQMISAQDKTGILTVQGEADIVAVSFKDGQVVGADALNQTVEEGLGQVLASQGMVSPADFSAVSEEHERTGKRLLDLVTERGLLDRSQLLEALRLQTYQLLLQLLRWEDGEFKFYSGDEVAFEEGFYAISVEELLMRSVSDLGEDHASQLPDLDGTYERTPGPHAIKVLGKDGEVPSPEDSAVWLDPEEKRLWGELDGSRSVREVARETGLGEYKVLFALYRLLGAEAVRPVPPRPEAVPPEVPPGRTEAPPPEPPERKAPRTGVEAPAEQPPAAAAPPAPALHTPADIADPAPVERAPARPGIDLAKVAAFVPLALALGFALMLIVSPFLLESSGSLLLPWPWQSRVRETLDSTRALTHYQRIDHNADTFFLLEGHYPDSLSELVDLRLMGPEDLRDALGRPLAYSSDDVSYLLQPVEDGRPADELPVRESITGDFLLDPDALDLPDEAEQAPLVLLD